MAGSGWRAALLASGMSLEPDDVAAYDQALAKVVVDGPQPLTAPIEIQNHDPVWPQLYAMEAARVRRVLGDRSCAWSMPSGAAADPTRCR
jgi:hypothetical protein